MSHHDNHTEDITTLYEGDQSKLYSGVLAHHESIDSTESKNKVKNILKVTGILTVITIIEVAIGLAIYGSNPNIPHGIVAAVFLIMTIIKAYYIVKVFMHLGDEKKIFSRLVLGPLTVLVAWLVIALLMDSDFHLHIGETFGFTIKSLIGR